MIVQKGQILNCWPLAEIHWKWNHVMDLVMPVLQTMDQMGSSKNISPKREYHLMRQYLEGILFPCSETLHNYYEDLKFCSLPLWWVSKNYSRAWVTVTDRLLCWYPVLVLLLKLALGAAANFGWLPCAWPCEPTAFRALPAQNKALCRGGGKLLVSQNRMLEWVNPTFCFKWADTPLSVQTVATGQNCV